MTISVMAHPRARKTLETRRATRSARVSPAQRADGRSAKSRRACLENAGWSLFAYKTRETQRSLSGVIGRLRMRRPVALKTAFVLAPATPAIPISPKRSRRLLVTTRLHVQLLLLGLLTPRLRASSRCAPINERRRQCSHHASSRRVYFACPAAPTA
jgi:hypothetical protein